LLRIAVVTAHYPSPARPTDGSSAYKTLRALSTRSEAQVFFPSASYPSFPKLLGRSKSRIDRSFNPPGGVNVAYYDYPAMPLVSRPFNGWIAAKTLLPYVRSFAPDIILSYFLYPDAFAALHIGQVLSVPVVAMGVGSDIHSIGDPVSAMHTRTVMREADCLLAVSEDLRRRAVAMGAPPKKTRTIVNGCDPSVFHVKDRLRARTVLRIDAKSEAVVYIGRMDVKKGLRELVEAAAALRSARPRLQVYLVGEGPDRPIIEQAIRSKAAAGYIHALPGCSFDDVATWMAAADLVTLPSYMEGCPNVVLEALACGRPVVATNVGGIPKIMSEECGRLVPPRDSTALVQALSSVLDKTWDANGISKRCSRSWDDVAGELLEIFESLGATRPAIAAV
jgi:glycosyltransferase involved in cell wall biosynthesis